MNSTHVVVEGEITADGALKLSAKPPLPPGPVRVTLEPIVAPPTARESWWDYLQRVRAEAEAAGGPFRSAEEIEAEREAFRADDEPGVTTPAP